MYRCKPWDHRQIRLGITLNVLMVLLIKKLFSGVWFWCFVQNFFLVTKSDFLILLNVKCGLNQSFKLSLTNFYFQPIVKWKPHLSKMKTFPATKKLFSALCIFQISHLVSWRVYFGYDISEFSQTIKKHLILEFMVGQQQGMTFPSQMVLLEYFLEAWRGETIHFLK